jgi:DnaJ-class molecular chaperone
MLAVFMPFLNKLLPKDSTNQPKSRYSPQNRNEKRSDSEDDWSQSYKQTIEPLDFVKKPGHRDSTIMICALCNGSGRHRLVDTCPGCGGKGSVLVIEPAKLCALCGGKGSKSVLKDPPCPACGGSGWPHTI